MQADNITIDATDTDLMSLDMFRVRTARYVPTGDTWLCLQASNGMTVGKPPGYSVPKAQFDANSAGVWMRYFNSPGFIGIDYQIRWGDVPTLINRPNMDRQFDCISPQTYNMTNIGDWPSVSCGVYPLEYFTVQ